VGGLALAGIPPTNGFISKMTLFQSGIQAEQWWSLMLLGFASIFTLIYVTRAFMRIWWQPVVGSRYGEDAYSTNGVKIKPYGDRLLAPALLIASALLLGLWAEPLVSLATEVSRWLGDPAAYIRAVIGG
jgi:multicomponent Na+:H+ antiporter subunit D